MKLVATAILLIAVAALLLSCGAQTEETTEAIPETTAAPPEASEPEAAVDTTPVEVTAEGSTFEPAVSKDSIPDGSWYCDMGTVHFARGEEGDGLCAVCGMRLVQMGAAATEEAAQEQPGHES